MRHGNRYTMISEAVLLRQLYHAAGNNDEMRRRFIEIECEI